MDAECTDETDDATPHDVATSAVLIDAPKATFGAGADARGKPGDASAVRIEHAKELLERGDVEGARRVLAALVEEAP